MPTSSMRFGSLALLSILLVAAIGCSNPLACNDDCVDNDFSLAVPAHRLVDVKKVSTIGGACTGAPIAAGDRYLVRATGEGNCRVEVDFTSGAKPFVTDFTFTYADRRCCGGFHPSPGLATIPSLNPGLGLDSAIDG